MNYVKQLLSFCTICMIGFVPLCWILRDGLGPDAIDSAGLEALGRFWVCFWWGPVFTVLLFAQLLLYLAVNQRKNRKLHE